MTTARTETVYRYTDAGGALLYEIVRRDPGKRFHQRRPDPNRPGHNINNLEGVERVPYRLPELVEAGNRGDTAWVVEGEKDADRLAGEGLIATTSAQGCWRWPPEWAEHFRGCSQIVVVPDNDDPGRSAARQRAEVIAARAPAWGGVVKLCDPLPGLGPGGDVSDFLDKGGTANELVELGERAEQVSAPEPVRDELTKSRGKNGAGELVELATDHGCRFFPSSEGMNYATVPVDGHLETYRMEDGRRFQQWLRRAYWLKYHKSPGEEALGGAVGILAAQASFEGAEGPVFLRVGGHEDAIYVDLGQPSWGAVRIDAGGWRLVSEPPVAFRRGTGSRALPTPRPGRGTGIKELVRLLNVQPEDRPLMLGYLVAALRPKGPYPALVLHGEHGSAKSTVTRIVRQLVDPSCSPVRAAPKEERDLVVAADNSWMLAFDNLSRLSPWLSDGLCRLSTGGGLSSRALYSNREEVIFEACRPVVLNGIEELAQRPDLIDRALIVRCPFIPEERRRTEEEFWADFEACRPAILGDLFDAVACGLRRILSVHMERLPRLADFACWVQACEPALDLAQGEFMAAYGSNRAEANRMALEDSPLVGPLASLAEEGWDGAVAQLLERLGELTEAKTRESKAWPASARKLRADLDRLAPNLRAMGVLVEPGGRQPGRGPRMVRVARPPERGQDPHNPHNPHGRPA